MAGLIFDFYDLMLFSFLLIPISLDLGINGITMSIIVGLNLLSRAIGGIIFGGLTDKYGRKKILQTTIIIYIVGTLLYAVSFNAISLLIFRTIVGLGMGGEWAAGQTYISETVPSEKRGRYGSMMQIGEPIGIIFASIVVGFLTPIIGWKLSFLIAIIPAIIVVFRRRSIQESNLWLKNKEKIKNRSLLNEFKTLLSKDYRKIFLLCLILCILGMSAYWFIFTGINEYLSHEIGLTVDKTTIILIITQIGTFFGFLSFGYVEDTIGRRPAFTLYTFILAISVSMITIMWNIINQIPILIFLFMFLVGFGTCYFGGFGTLFTELFPTKIRSTGSGTAFSIAR